MTYVTPGKLPSFGADCGLGSLAVRPCPSLFLYPENTCRGYLDDAHRYLMRLLSAVLRGQGPRITVFARGSACILVVDKPRFCVNETHTRALRRHAFCCTRHSNFVKTLGAIGLCQVF